MMADTVLDEVPSLGSLYSQVLGRTVRNMMARTSRATKLPNVTYRVAEAPVDAAHLADYQHLLGEPGVDALPAGYVHVLGFPLAMAVMVRPDFPLPVMGMVHIANTVEQFHPLTLTDTLRIRAWAQDLRAHRSGTQVDLVVEVSAQEGPEIAWRGRSTYLAKGHEVPGLTLVETPKRDDGEQTVPQATAQWRLTPSIARRYAAVSGDRNPIHMSSLSAKLFGFPTSIAHGMYGASRALAAIGPARGDAFVWDVEFAKPVFLPSTVAVATTERDSGVFDYVAWKRGSETKDLKKHFSGTVRPLP